MKFTDPQGRTLEVNSPDGSIPTEQELDQMFSMKYGGGQPDNLKNFSNAESNIKSRFSPIADLTKNPTTWQHPLGAALRTLSGASALVEGVPASIALDLQRGRPQDIGQNLAKTVTGQRTPQYGDVFKGSGAPDAVAAPLGLYSSMALSPGGAAAMKSVGTGVANVAGKGIQGVGKLAAGGWDALKKSSADYVTSDVAPRAYKIYQDAVQKFTPEIQKFAEEKLNIPKSAIDTIKQSGVQNIQQTRQVLNDSTDQIVQNVQKGFAAKDQAVADAYSKAFSNVPEGTVIHVDSTKRAMGALLRKAGYLGPGNKPTALAANDITENSPLRKLMGFYQSIGANQDAKITAVTPFQWNLFRDALSKSRAGSGGLSSEITNILDSLHADAERAGVKGIIQARSLARANFDAQDTFSQTLFKEGKLKNYHNLTGAEKRQLEDAQKYTGVNFIDPLKKVSTGQYVDKLLEYNPERFAKDLNEAVTPKWTNYYLNKYKDLLGPQKAQEIFNDIVQHRRGLSIKTGTKVVAGGAAGIFGAEKGYHFVRKALGQ